MKAVVVILAEFIFFFLLDLTGGVFYHPFHLETKLQSTLSVSRSFFWDGILLMLSAWLIVLLIGALRKRLSASATHATIALALATTAGLLLKVGFVTHDL